MHVYLFVDETPRCGKFRWGDIKAKGGYVLIPPSVHPSGVIYHVVDEFAGILRVGELAEVIPDPPDPPSPAPLPLVHVYPGSDLWPLSVIEQIKKQVSILELLPDARQSGGAGRWWMSKCPLHNDQAPSMRVDTQIGVVTCFSGCARGLDVIGLFGRLQGLSNREAIRKLAERL